MSVIHARLPGGGTFEHWTAPDGWRIRTACWPGKRGTLLLANGRGDFIEKYGEAVRHWTERGWSVLAFDWRGQGGSGRAGRTPLHGASAGFECKLSDLRGLIGHAAETGPAPLAAAGHSMGGHLLLRALAEGETRLPRVILNAPMLGIRTPGMAGWLAAGTARVGGAFMPGKFGPGQRATFDRAQMEQRQRVLTSCPERGAEEYAQLALAPELAVGGVTWGWLADAYRSMRVLAQPGTLESITTPVRFVLAGSERVVSNAAALAAVARMLRADYAIVPGGAHELWRETDAARAAAFGAADEFLETA